MQKICFFILLAFFSGNITPVFAQQDTGKEMLYVGTYSQRGSKGIYVFEFDREKADLELVQTVPGENHPSFLAVHPNGGYLYAVYEGSDKVVSYEIRQTGELTRVNHRSTEGSGPCHVSVDPQGQFVYVSNYGNGSLAVYPVAHDGSLESVSDVIVHEGSGPNAARQKGPHMHSMVPSENGRYIYASDLGTDEIIAYDLNRKKGTLSAGEKQKMKVKPGAGPRHFDIHPTGKYAYSVEELTSKIAAYTIDQQTGSLELLERESMVPTHFNGNNTGADIQVSPDGKFVYASNRGHNSLAIFAIDGRTGKLQPQGYASTRGERPRNFLIDKHGTIVFVANRNSDNGVVFRRNPRTGKLKYTGKEVQVPAAVCVQYNQYN